MDGRKSWLITIGEASRRSGVPVKTIRYYSDEGLLPPSGITEAGYRLYSEEDLALLETIRSLRAAGFGLGTIAALVSRRTSPQEAARLQLEAVNLQLRELNRRRALLESVVGAEGEALASYLDRARALALLSAKEREAFLGRHLERAIEGVPVDPDWKEGLWRGAVLDLPDELTDEQLDAWRELAEMVSDEGFGEALRRQSQPFWESVEEGAFDLTEWNEAQGNVISEAVAAVRKGVSSAEGRGQRVVGGYLEALARVMGREGDEDGLAKWWLSHYEATNDPRFERYWELIRILKGWPKESLQARAYEWLMEGLRHRIAGR